MRFIFFEVLSHLAGDATAISKRHDEKLKALVSEKLRTVNVKAGGP
jgi:hypothetical protein